MKKKTLGSMLMVAGTTIGAGMLVMPINSAEVGLFATLLELGVFLFAMLIPALSITELVQFAPTGTSVSGLVRLQLGRPGLLLSNVLVYIFLYSLICAYVSGLTSMLMGLLGVDEAHKVIFTIAAVIPFGAIVIFTSRFADIINQLFFYVMIIALVMLIFVATGHIKLENLYSLPKTQLALFKSMPIFFLAYGFHTIIPSISDYLDRDTKELKKALFGGLLIPFLIFGAWNIVVHGLATQEELITFSAGGNPDIATLIVSKAGDKSVDFLAYIITAFSFTALVTSFIGVSLALVTNLKELFSTNAATKATNEHNQNSVEDEDLFSYEEKAHLDTKLRNPFLIFLLCYALPVTLVLYIPQAFLFFLKLASLIFTIQSLVLPMITQVLTRMRQPELYTANTYRLCLPNIVILALSVIFTAIAVSTVI